MKINGRIAVLLSAMVAIFIIGMDSRVEASQYLGQVTWTWHKTVDETGTVPEKTETVVAKLFLLGNSCYELVGSSTDTESGETSFGAGTAMLVGNDLIMTLSTTKVRLDGKRETAIFQGQVNKTTFNGSGWNIKKRFDPVNHVFIDKYAAGTLTLVGNPPPLGVSIMAPLSLLLND